ncbi:hypothetical protein SLS62_001022 [Diatrype stigma]|uniref:GST N-terminal domain-containing protein n=1 Tax=Diatrype stigma TaxID=117547 RepID=A0AAN9V0Q5_9PEZI
MSAQQLVLFDLPSKAPLRAWSYNPWRKALLYSVRLALNYKGIDYRTEWLEYPDLKPSLPGLSEYTTPTVMMPSGEYIMDSWKIAEALEAAFPGTPSLRLDAPALAPVKAAMLGALGELRGVYVPLVAQRLLGEASLPYFTATRQANLGMPLDQFAREKGGDRAFAAAAPHVQKAAALLRAEGAEGPFFDGAAAPGFADFVWAGLLLFLQRIGEDDVLLKLLDAAGDREPHLRLLEAVRPWSERGDY